MEKINDPLKKLRTYEEDVKNVVENENISTSKIMLAEQKKREQGLAQSEAITKRKAGANKELLKKSRLFLFSLVFLALGVGAVYAAIFYIKPMFDNDQALIVLDKATFIETEQRIGISTKGKNARQIISEIREYISQIEDTTGDIVELVLTKEVAIATEEGEVVEIQQLTSENFFLLLENQSEDFLTRALEPEIILGVHIQEKNEPFIIMRANSLDQSFAGMLEWEKRMVKDIRDIFFENLGSSQNFPGEIVEVATTLDIATSTDSIATTTEEVMPTEPTYDPTNFRDLIISNKDIRAIFDSEGKLLFFYTFADNEHIILTTNRETLDVLIQKLNRAKLVR